MATLYWGGGTGTWDGFTTTNWYTDVARTVLSTRAPSAEDDVVFDSASNATAYTVTIANGTTVCRNVTISGPASGNVTIAGTGQWFIYGSLTLPATGITRTFTGTISFYGATTHNITTNGVTLASNFLILGGGTYTLQTALTTTGLVINNGTLTTNNNNVTLTGSFGATTAGGTLNLGSSTVSATFISGDVPLIINSGTSNITLTDTSPSIGGGTSYTGNTFNNVIFSSNAITSCLIYGNNTFNNLTFTTPAAARVSVVELYGNQTVSGTLTIVGQSSVNRYFVRSNLVGTARTLTVGTVATLTDVDFRDITVAGASSPWSGTRLGNCGGNTNITFPVAKTVYWVNAGGAAWESNSWATGSGGSVATANFPLAQDTAIIDTAGTAATTTISGSIAYNLGTLSITSADNVTISPPLILYGNCTFSATTTASSFNPVFAGRVTQDFTSAGKNISRITCNGSGASVRLIDALTTANWTITSGGLNTNNQSFTVTSGVVVSSSNTAPFTLTLGSSAVSIAGTASLSSSGTAGTTAPTMTVSAGTSTITLTDGNASFGFEGQPLTWYNVTRSAASAGGTFRGTNTFNNLTFTAPTATGVSNIALAGNQTVTGTLAWGGGTSVTQRLGVVSNTPGTARTITAAAVSGLSDIDFRDITVAGASSPWSGTRLGDCGGNTNITFPAPKTVYWNLAGTQNWSATGWATSSGGTPAANNFPLAQDTAVFDNTGAAGTVTLNAAWNVGTINASARTSAMTLAGSGGISVYGDVTYGSGITSTASGTWNFRKPGTQVFTTAGKSLANSVTVNNPSCLFRHGDAFTSTNSTITVTSGSYETQNYNVTVPIFSSSNANTRSITFGTSTVTCSGLTPFIFTNSTGLTFSGGSSTINLSGTTNKTFAGGGQTFGTVSSTGGTTNPLAITGSNTFGTLTNTARTYLIFAAGTTQTITNFTYSGSSGSVVRWYTSIPGQQATISTGSYAVGANSVDGGNNTGLSFTGSSPDYFYVKDISAGSTAINVFVVEASTGTDAISSLLSVFSSFTGIASGADALSALAAFDSSLADTASGADALSALAAFDSSLADTASGADATAATPEYPAEVSDTAAGADVVVVLAEVYSNVADTATGLDTLNTSVEVFAVADESGVGADSVAANTEVIAATEDAANTADATDASLTVSPTVSESSTSADQASADASFVTDVSEVAGGADTVSTSAELQGAVADTSSGADSVSANSVLSGFVSESGSANEQASASVAFNSLVLDTGAASDQIVTSVELFSAIAESSQGADQLAVFNTITVTISEAGVGADEVTALVVVVASVDEGSTGADEIFGQPGIPTEVSETATGVDQAFTTVELFGVVGEVASGVDALNALASFFAQVENTAVGADAPAASAAFLVAVQDTVVAAGQFVGSILWVPIPDDQNANWGSINTSQVPTWTSVSTGNTVVWASTNTSQTPSWGAIDTVSPDNWAPINTQ